MCARVNQTDRVRSNALLAINMEAALPTTPSSNRSRTALGALSRNTPISNTPKQDGKVTPRSSKPLKTPTCDRHIAQTAEVVEAFGVIGVLEATRGPAPQHSPQLQWPAQWPAEWDEGTWEWEGGDGWAEGWDDKSWGHDHWDAEWDEHWSHDPHHAPEPALRLNNHIRFPKTPSPSARVMTQDPTTPLSRADAIAIAVASSGGKAVKKSKSKGTSKPIESNGSPSPEASAEPEHDGGGLEAVGPSFMAVEEVRLARVMQKHLTAKGLATIGARARAARAAARAASAAEDGLETLVVSSPSGAGPVPVRSIGHGQPHSRMDATNAHVNDSFDYAFNPMAAEHAEEALHAQRAEEIRAEMYAMPRLLTPVAPRHVPFMPAPGRADAPAAIRGSIRGHANRAQGKPTLELASLPRVTCVAAQALEDESVCC